MILFTLLAITLVAFPSEACVSTPPPPAATPAPTIFCVYPPGKLKCFLLIKDAKDWHDARFDCKQQGGDLATLDSLQVDSNVTQYIAQNGIGDCGFECQVCTISILQALR